MGDNKEAKIEIEKLKFMPTRPTSADKYYKWIQYCSLYEANSNFQEMQLYYFHFWLSSKRGVNS